MLLKRRMIDRTAKRGDTSRGNGTMSTTSFAEWLCMNEPENSHELFALHLALEIGGDFDLYFGDHAHDGRIFLRGWHGGCLALASDRAISSFKKVLREQYAAGFDVDSFCGVQHA
jgi:hypothetical protein